MRIGLRVLLGYFVINFAVSLLHERVGKLRDMSPLWEMVQEGIDLNTVEWAAH